MRTVSSLFILAGLLVITGCGGDSGPDAAAVAFVHALGSGEVDQLIRFAPPDERDMDAEERAMAAKVMAMIKEDADAEGGISRVEAVNSEVRGDEATVTVKITMGNGSVEEDTIHLKKADGEWYVDRMEGMEGK